MTELLIKEERASVTTELKRYSQQRFGCCCCCCCYCVFLISPSCRDIPELVDRLSDVITDKKQSVLLHYICQMLPETSQTEFDNLAATKLAKCKEYHNTHSIVQYSIIQYKYSTV